MFNNKKSLDVNILKLAYPWFNIEVSMAWTPYHFRLKGHNFVTARLKSPHCVFTVTTLTMPSAPGWRVTTLPSSHRNGGTPSSTNRTIVLSLMMTPGAVHLLRFCNSDRYSCCHRCHSNCRALDKCCQCDSRLSGICR